MRLPIKAKIGFASVVTIGLVGGLIVFMVRAQHNLVTLMNAMIEKNMATMRLAEQLKYNVVLADDLLFRYIATDDQVHLAEAQRIRDSVRKTIHQMQEGTTGPTERELLQELDEQTSRYDQDVKLLVNTHAFKTEAQKTDVVKLIKSLESGAGAAPAIRQTQKQTIALLSAEGRARLTRIYSQCEKLVDISRSKLEDAQERVHETVEETKRLAWGAGGAVMGATLLVAFFLAMSLLSPMQRLLSGVQKVTAGELNLELPVEGSDEIGRLTREFNVMTRNLKEKQQLLLTETITDSLTELFNFRYFQTQIKDEISRANRYKHSLTLLIFDIDHFKHYNDTNGHQMGNAVLKQVAHTLQETLRQEDFIARYGGEEFVALLPETDGDNARIAAERLRLAIEQGDFPNGQKQPGGRLTISIGAAIFPSDSTAPSRLVEKADRALYAAKKAGRNQVVWAQQEDEPTPPTPG